MKRVCVGWACVDLLIGQQRREGSYLAILGFGPLVFANVGVNLMAPTLRALLAGAAGHLGGDGGPSVAVLGLFAREERDCSEKVFAMREVSVRSIRRVPEVRRAGRLRCRSMAHP